MMSADLLESFDEAPAASLQSQTYKKGFEDGHTAALDALNAEQSRLSEELVQSIKDLEFSFAEARADLTAALAPLFTAIGDKIFPAIIDEVFARKIAEIIGHAAAAQVPESFQLAVHPDNCEALRAAIQPIGADLTIIADAALGRHAARLNYADIGEIFDAETLLHEVAGVLQTIPNTTERNRAHE